MNIVLRIEEEKDYKGTENLTREAFWDKYRPGCDEHLVAHQLRLSQAFIPQLDFVAFDGEKMVGNIMCSKTLVVNADTVNEELICLGPVSVLPEYQHKGVGSLLIKKTIEVAKKMGYKAIFLYGNPAYYSRFGFVNAEKYGLQTSEGTNGDFFMVLPLGEDNLKGISGKCLEDAAFQVNKEELAEFEKQFPFKEKHVKDMQMFKE